MTKRQGVSQLHKGLEKLSSSRSAVYHSASIGFGPLSALSAPVMPHLPNAVSTGLCEAKEKEEKRPKERNCRKDCCLNQGVC